MKFKNKAKPIKFSLLVGGRECRSVEDVKKNFDLGSLCRNFDNGNLQKWLKQIGESSLLNCIDDFSSVDLLTKKICLYNLFASEPLSSSEVNEENILQLSTKGCIIFDDLNGTSFVDNIEIKKSIVESTDNDTINRWCENDLELLKYVYYKKSYDNLDAHNCMRLINEKLVANDEIFAMLVSQKIDYTILNQLCENDLELLKYVYSKKSYDNLNAQNCSTLINQNVVTNENLIMEIATKKNLHNILERLSTLFVVVGGVDVEMILVKGYSGGDFYIGKYPVTQAQWRAVMGNNPSKFKGEDNPVEQVSWNDSQQFINGLNSKTGRKFRLPKEAEWEYAARGGNKTHNYTYSGSNCLDEVGWSKSNSGNSTHPVGKKKPNELGIYDMSGNVLEWCEDLHLLSFLGSERVSRGGSWSFGDSHCAISYRNNNSNHKYCNYGFRLAMDA